MIRDLGTYDSDLEPISAEVRDHALKGLAKEGTAAIEPLIAALRDDDYYVRTGAIEALGEIGGPRAAQALVALREDDSEFTGSRDGLPIEAVDALCNIGEPAVQPLMDAVHGGGISPRGGSIADALVGIGGPAVEPLIADLSSPEEETRWRAATLLEEIRTPAVQALLSRLDDSNPRVRLSAYGILSKIGDPRSTQPLMAAYRKRDWDVIYEASLWFIHQAGTEPILVEALNRDNTERNVRLASEFLNSDKPRLVEAAREWADRNGYAETTRRYIESVPDGR